jgi:purine-cytosine permease-like protein
VLAVRAHWSVLFGARTGPHLALLSGFSIVVASGGISWVNLSADYTRYLPRRESRAKVVSWTVLGAALPLSVLIVMGVLLSSTIPGLASTPNPVAAVGSVLPSWMAAPYLLVALGGLLSQMVMGLYSSGLGLLVLGVRIRRSRTVLIDTSVVVLAGSLFTIVHQGFLAPFVSFVELLACPIATWAAVFVVDMAINGRAGAAAPAGEGGRRAQPERALRASAVISWLAGTTLGLACTESPLFTGPLARGPFAGSSLGYILGFFVSGGLYLLAKAAMSAALHRS